MGIGWFLLALAAFFLLLGLIGLFARLFLEAPTRMGHKND